MSQGMTWQQDSRRDRRGRYRQAPAILHYGFRPFFLLAGLHAGISIPVWLWMSLGGTLSSGPFSGRDWHVHEMLFGYVAAVMAGFILAAIPNWTGRFPLSGPPLAGLVALWILGRVSNLVLPSALGAMAIDLMFPVTLAFVVWREIMCGRNRRNTPVAMLLSVFAIANALHHLDAMDLVARGMGFRLALGVIATMIALIGGRIIPSFTRNWLAARGNARLPAKQGVFDSVTLVFTASGLLMWQVFPYHPATGFMLALAGIFLLFRLVRWRGTASLGNPIVAVLHVGYAWLAISLGFLGSAIVWPGLVPSGSAIHALTAGAIGTMTLAVMTRASLGHTGHEIRADVATCTIYLFVSLGALLRVLAPVTLVDYHATLVTGGVLWSAAFMLFVVRYGPMLYTPRLQKPVAWRN
jgi:uncharacterized protein involved in response to NO